MNNDPWRHNTPDEMLEIVTAIKNGTGPIQYRVHADKNWNTTDVTSFVPNFLHVQYRLKPGPLVVYGWVNVDGRVAAVYYTDRECALYRLNCLGASGWRVAKFVEEVE